MLTITGATNILKQIVGLDGGQQPKTAYLGLLTEKPNISGEDLKEVPIHNEEKYIFTNYKRVLIGRSGNNTTPYTVFSTVKREETEPGVYNNTLYIINETEVHFNEVPEGHLWGTITHFAIFPSETATTATYVGKLKEPITPLGNTVPLARKGAIYIALAPAEEL